MWLGETMINEMTWNRWRLSPADWTERLAGIQLPRIEYFACGTKLTRSVVTLLCGFLFCGQFMRPVGKRVIFGAIVFLVINDFLTQCPITLFPFLARRRRFLIRKAKLVGVATVTALVRLVIVLFNQIIVIIVAVKKTVYVASNASKWQIVFIFRILAGIPRKKRHIKRVRWARNFSGLSPTWRSVRAAKTTILPKEKQTKLVCMLDI